MDQRVYLLKNGVATDLTIAVSQFDSISSSITMDLGTDYIYVGTSLPFNHRWLEIGTANATASTPTIEVWYAGAWKEAVDILDRTSSSGASMALSGNLEFTPNRDFGWDIEQDSIDIAELVNAPLTYNKYWMRISFSATITFSLDYVGQKFADDADLYGKYPTFDSSSLLTAWQSGKTNWDKQHFLAADELVEDLISRRIAWDRNQVIDLASLKNPAVHKAATIIFRGLGANRNPEQLKDAIAKYHSTMNKKQWRMDLDGDGLLDQNERKASTIFMSR